MDPLRRIGEDLRGLREKRGLSRAAAGARSELSEAEIASIERGAVALDWKPIVKLAGVYGVKLGPPLDRVEWDESRMSIVVRSAA